MKGFIIFPNMIIIHIDDSNTQTKAMQLFINMFYNIIIVETVELIINHSQ